MLLHPFPRAHVCTTLLDAPATLIVYEFTCLRLAQFDLFHLVCIQFTGRDLVCLDYLHKLHGFCEAFAVFFVY